MMKIAQNPKDILDLQFKLQCRLKVFDNTNNSSFPQQCSLIACASRFGLIFVGTNSSALQAIQLKSIETYTNAKEIKCDYPRRILTLSSSPSHISVNCEHTVVAIVIERAGCPWALFYDTKSFLEQEITQLAEVSLSPTPSVFVREINWNPAVGSICTACKSDSALGIYEIKNPGIDINELPAAAGATCFCWSPKGKQIAVGSRDGKITQLKPDLKAVKVIGPPPLSEPHALLSLQWVSNYQFIGVFQSNNPDAPVLFIVIDAPKTGEPTYTNYYDICYGSGNVRPTQFYTIMLHSWNVLMAASSNSMEVGVLGNVGESWIQWSMPDGARAELPLDTKRQETFPIGCGLDTGPTTPIPWGEATLLPAPMLLLLSHHGVLCCFNIIYLKDGIPSICSPPEILSNASGLQHFVISNTGVKSAENVVKTVTEVPPEPPLKAAISTPSAIVTQSTNLPPVSGLNLFGGQTTLTPIPQADKKASFFNQYQALFPTMMGQEKINEVKETPQINVVATSVVTPVNLSITTKSSQSSIPTQAVQKSSEISLVDNYKKTHTVNIDFKEDDEEVEKIFAQMIKEEYIYLESELQAVLHQGRSLKFNLGTEEDKQSLVDNINVLKDFFDEVNEICVMQNSEVHTLKQNLLQSWTWYEEARFRHLASEEDYMNILIRAQPLDSSSEKQLADIQHMNYYLESQISQAHLALDEQWENFQDYCRKTDKIQIPTMELIFQTLVKQNAILQKKAYILKGIASRIKSKSRSAVKPLLISSDALENLPDDLKRLEMNPDDISRIHYEHATKRMKNFTKNKAAALRSFLKNREISHVVAAKPQLTSSIIQVSPVSKLKQSHFISSESPSVVKQSSPKVLHFSESTPVKSEMQPNNAIQGLQNFTFKFDANNFKNMGNKSFTPFMKNPTPTSLNSAFVSTSVSSVSPSIVNPTLSALKSTPNFATVSKESSQPVITISTKTSTQPFTFGSKSDTNLFTDMAGKSKIPYSNYSIANNSSFFGTPEEITLFPKATTVSSNLVNTKASTTESKTFSNPTLSKTGIATTLSTASNQTTSSIFGTATNPTSPAFTTANNSFAFSSKTISSIAGTSASPLPKSQFTSSTLVTNLSKVTNTSQATSPLPLTSKTSSFDTTSSSQTVVTTSAGFSFGGFKSTVSTISVPPSNVATTASSILHQPLTSKPNVFGFQNISAVTTTSSTELTPSASKSVFGSTDTSKSSIFGNVSSTTPTTTQSSLFSAITSKSSTLFGSLVTTASQTPSFEVTSTQSAPTTQTPLFGISTTAMQSPISTSTTSTTTQSGLFSISSPTTQSTVLGVSSTNTTQSLFGVSIPSAAVATQSPLSSTGTITSSAPSVLTIPVAPSPLFGASTTATTSASLFGTSTTSTVSSSFGGSTIQSPIFGTASTTSTPSVFGTSTTSSIFGSTPVTTTPLAFGAKAFGVPAQSQIFGTAASTPTSPIFGNAITTTASAPTSINQPIFGNVVTSTVAAPTSLNQSIFGNAVKSTVSAPTSITQPIFGATVTSNTPPSPFGAAPTSTVQSQSIFGAVAPSTPSVFGVTPVSTTSSVFGATPASSSPSIFGGSTTTVSQSVFGSSVTSQPQGFGMFSEASQKTSIFGNSSSSSAQPSIFGNSNQSSVFGNPTSTATSVFGQNQPPAFGQSVFGNTNSFAPNAFATPPSTFGQPSAFGSTATSASVFGANPTTQSSAFGSPPSPFGGTQTSTFSPNANNSLSLGGLNVGAPPTSTSGFGSPVNPFGAKSVFGNPPVSSSSSIFNSGNNSMFGSPSQSGFGSGFGGQSTFGQGEFQNSFGGSFSQPAGPFSTGGSGVGQTGFGTSNFQTMKPGFGGSPVFGGSPAFSTAPSFGGAATFGSPAPFGSPSKVFGSSGTTFGGEATAQNTAFGNLANQPTVGFGNLAQQATAGAPTSPFGGGTSSFSSWR